MSNPPLTHAAVVANTKPAQAAGPEPLTGQYVTLERLAQKHYADLYTYTGPAHSSTWEWWPAEPPATPAKFDEYLDEFLKLSPDDVAIYAVLPLSEPNEGRALGLAIVMSEHRLTHRVAELGAFFGPALQGTRAGTEAIYLLGQLMFDLNHRRLGWKTNALNLQSRKAAERLGFVHEGILRQEQINKGRNRDTAWYSIIDSEWPVCKKAFELWLDNENFDELQHQKRRLQDIRESLK